MVGATDVVGDRLVLHVAAVANGYTVDRIEAGRPAPVRAASGPVFRILRADGTPLVADQPGLGVSSARAVVAHLEHIARWEQLKALGGHPSRLRDAIRLELFEAGASDPGQPAAIAAGRGGGRLPPRLPAAGRRLGDAAMLLRLVNTTKRDLFVGVLDLTDRFRCHASLFPTALITAVRPVAIWDGRPIPAVLPADRPIVSGAIARDWLKVVVSEEELRCLGLRDVRPRRALRRPSVGGRGPVGARASGRPRAHPWEVVCVSVRLVEPGVVRRHVRDHDRGAVQRGHRPA